MVMMAERPTAPIPLEQAIAELDSAEAVADRRKRAAEWGKRLVGDERNQMIYTASREEISAAMAPLNADTFRWDQGTERQKKEASLQAGQNMNALVARQCEQALRRSDEAALYRDPDRLEEQRIWNAYTHQVSAAAWRQGNKSDGWVRRWQETIADRAAAEDHGDSTAAIDARLLRHVGTPFPQLPGAAWDTADLLPAADRQLEYERLTPSTGLANQSRAHQSSAHRSVVAAHDLARWGGDRPEAWVFSFRSLCVGPPPWPNPSTNQLGEPNDHRPARP